VQSLVCAVVGFAIMVVVFPWFVVELAAALAAGALPWIRIIFLRARRMKAFDDALAQGIDMMARALRAGHSVSGAIELIAQGCPEPAASEFSEVFRQQNFGMPLRDAFMQMLDRVPSQDLRVVVTAILVQRETGGNLVEILDRTVGVIRDRQRIHGEIRTQTAQGRLTGWILTLLPVVMLALINVTNPGYSKPRDAVRGARVHCTGRILDPQDHQQDRSVGHHEHTPLHRAFALHLLRCDSDRRAVVLQAVGGSATHP
jgi:tight adherence protein B